MKPLGSEYPFVRTWLGTPPFRTWLGMATRCHSAVYISYINYSMSYIYICWNYPAVTAVTVTTRNLYIQNFICDVYWVRGRPNIYVFFFWGGGVRIANGCRWEPWMDHIQNVLKVFLKKRGSNSRPRRILNEDGWYVDICYQLHSD